MRRHQHRHHCWSIKEAKKKERVRIKFNFNSRHFYCWAGTTFICRNLKKRENISIRLCLRLHTHIIIIILRAILILSFPSRPEAFLSRRCEKYAWKVFKLHFALSHSTLCVSLLKLDLESYSLELNYIFSHFTSIPLLPLFLWHQRVRMWASACVCVW